MKSHMTRDIKGCSASWRQIILPIYNALNVLSFRHQLEGLPKNFDDIQIVNVFEAPGKKGDDWMAHLNGQGQAWIITPLYYNDGGSNAIRSASGGGRWHARDRQLKNHEGASWFERKYKLVERTNKQQATKEGAGLPKCTMVEYSPDEIKPTHALCRITVHNENNASSQQREGKEIDHTDSNNRDKRKTSLSQESMHHGGNFENARQYCNPSNLEMFFARIIQGGELSEFMKHFSKDYIVQVFSRKMDEKPAASPKEHSTEAAVRNPRKRGRFTCTNTMEEGTFTQGQEQVKVEMSASNSYAKKPTSLRRDTNRNCSEFGKQSSHHGNCNEKNAEQGTNTINLATIFEELLQLCKPDGHEMFDPNANVQDPDNLFVNFNANSTEGTENSNQLPSYSTIAPGPSTSNHATSVSEIPDWLTIAKEWLDLDDLS